MNTPHPMKVCPARSGLLPRQSAPWRWLRRGVQALVGAGLAAGATALPAQSADRVSLSYGPLELSVTVQDLETFANTGDRRGNLRLYTSFIGAENQQLLRQALSERAKFDQVAVSQLLYSAFGETSLDYLGEMIQTDSRQNGFYALRTAAIQAAGDPDGLTLLNLIKKFPTDTMRIQSTRVMQVSDEFSQLLSQTDRITNWLEQETATNAATQQPIALPQDWQKSGAWSWQVETLHLNDASRHRQLAVDLYLPDRSADEAADRLSPVLVISHGLAADRGDFADLAEFLASHGFAVAVPDHPGSDTQQLQKMLRGLASEMAEPDEFYNRPLDISFLLDELTQRNQSDPQLQGRLNLSQVGVIGHSLGGYTALSLAGAELNLDRLRQECQPSRVNLNSANFSMLIQCQALHSSHQDYSQLRDPRVKAIVAVNPISNTVFGQSGLQSVQVPVMLIGGSNDPVTPALIEQVCPFTWLTGPHKYLAVINKGTHTYSEASSGSLPMLSQVNPDPSLAQSYMQSLSLAFAQVYVAQQPDSKRYLKAGYIEAISRSPLKLSLLDQVNTSRLSQTLGEACPSQP